MAKQDESAQTELKFLTLIASYVPPPVLREFIRNPQPVKTSSVKTVEGTVLFADISGYTRMTEVFAKEGAIGAEKISGVLNKYFGLQGEVIREYGGDVMRYAGDGLLALFPFESWSFDTPATLCRKAVKCSLDMLADLNNYEVTKDCKLQLHMGLGSGNIIMMNVGSELGWECIVGGDPLTQIAGVVDEAKPGEVVLAKEGWPNVKDCCQANITAGGNYNIISIESTLKAGNQIVIKKGMEAAIRGFIPNHVLAPLDARREVAELRKVTVLFIVFAGLKMADDKNTLAQIQNIYHIIQTTLKKYEGGIKEFSVDDKGVVAVTGFGLPPFGHEDDSARGVYAAFDITSTVARIENKFHNRVTCRMGVTSGDVFCGTVGSASRREFAMIGDTVNLAARLMMKAEPNGILCDNYTYMEVKSLAKFQFEALPPMKLKGKEQMVPIFKPMIAGNKVDSIETTSDENFKSKTETVIVGRSIIIHRLQSQIDELYQGGDGGVVLIIGHAGIGKSILLKDVARMANAKPIKTFFGAGDSLESSTPYYVWRNVFIEALELAQIADKEQRRLHVKVIAAEDSYMLGYLPLLNAVIPLDLPENDETQTMSKQVRGTATQRLLLKILQNLVVRGPKVLLLEDLHLLDSASWSLLVAAVGEVSPMLFACSCRPIAVFTSESMRSDFKKLCRFEYVEVLELEPLEPQHALSLVCNLLDVSSIPKQVSDIIIKQGQGNPFFCEQITRMLCDSGQVRVQHGKCRVMNGINESSTITVPDTVQGIITSRIDRLNQNEQATLKVASVIGCLFSLQLLASIHPVSKHVEEITNNLNGLVAADIIREVSPGQYEFKNLISQEVGYNQMLFAHRRKLHVEIGKWYEKEKADIISTFYTLLAHHWVRAEMHEKSFEYLEKAGMQALGNHGYQEAATFLSQALKLDAKIRSKDPTFTLNQSLRLAGWEAYLGRAQLALGNIVEGRNHLETCLKMLGLPLPRNSFSRTMSTFSNSLRQLRLRVFPFTPSNNVDEEKSLYATHCYGWLFEIYYFGQSHQLAMNAALKAINCAEEANLLSELSRGFANMSVATENCRMYSLASTYNILSRKLALNMDKSCQAWVLGMAGTQHLSSGLFAKAQNELNYASEISSELGDRRRWEESLNTLALTYYIVGDNLKAYDLCKKVHDSGKNRGDIQTQSWGMLGQARSLAIRGHSLEESLLLLQQRDHLLDEHAGRRTRASEINAFGITALVHMRRRDYNKAMALATDAVSVIQSNQTPTAFLYPGYASVMDIIFHVLNETDVLHEVSELSTQQRDQVKILVLEAWRRFAKQILIGKPRYLLAQALYKMGQKRHNVKTVITLLKSSASSAESFGMKYEAAICYYYISRLQIDNTLKQEYLTKAMIIFKKFDFVSAIKECHHYSQTSSVKLSLETVHIAGDPQVGSILKSNDPHEIKSQPKLEDGDDGIGFGNTPRVARRRSSLFNRDLNHVTRHDSFNEKIGSRNEFEKREPQAKKTDNYGYDVYPDQLELLKKEVDNLLSNASNATPNVNLKCKLVTVEGQCGIGKTKLLSDVALYAKSKSINCYTGAGNKLETATPYYMWRMIFEDLADLPKFESKINSAPIVRIRSNSVRDANRLKSKANSDISSFPKNSFATSLISVDDEILLRQRAKLEHELGTETELLILLPLLNTIVPLDFKENEYTKSLSVEERAEKTLFLLEVFLFKLISKNKGLLLQLEDAQWIDAQSRQLLNNLLSRSVNLLIFAALRTPCFNDEDSVIKSLASQSLYLEALSKAEISTLICKALRVQHLGNRLNEFIYKVAEGHPYFSVGLAFANRDINLIYSLEESGAHIAHLRDDFNKLPIVPVSISKAVLSRIDLLNNTQQKLLNAATVIGIRFNIQTLASVSNVAAKDLTEDLKILVTRGFLKVFIFDKVKSDLCHVSITENIDLVSPNYIFVFQNLVYLVVRSMASNSDFTAKMHKNLAEHIEFTYASNLAPMFTLLDHHWNMANYPNHSGFYKELTSASYVFPYSFIQESLITVINTNRTERGVDELGKSYTYNRMGGTKAGQEQVLWFGLLELNISRMTLISSEHTIRMSPFRSLMTQSKMNKFKMKFLSPFKKPKKSKGGRISDEDKTKLDVVSAFIVIISSCLESGRLNDAEYYARTAMNIAFSCPASLQLAQLHAIMLCFNKVFCNKKVALWHADRCFELAQLLINENGKDNVQADYSFSSTYNISTVSIYNRLGHITLKAAWLYYAYKYFDKAISCTNEAGTFFKHFHHWPMVNICKHRVVEIHALTGHIDLAKQVNNSVDIRLSKEFDLFNRTIYSTKLELFTIYWKHLWGTLLNYRSGNKEMALKSLNSMQETLNATVRTESYDTTDHFVWLETLGWDKNNELPSYLNILSDSLTMLVNMESGNYVAINKDAQVFLNTCVVEFDVPLLYDLLSETLIRLCRLNTAEKSPLVNLSTERIIACLKISVDRQTSLLADFPLQQCSINLRQGQLHHIQGNMHNAQITLNAGLKHALSTNQSLVAALIQQELAKNFGMKEKEELSIAYFTRIDAKVYL